MRLNIPVELPKRELEITHSTTQMILGSCFAENIGKRLVACKFPVTLNPFGIIYNPLSIATALDRIIEMKAFTENSPEIVNWGEQWHSMLHHGDFSRCEKNDTLADVNNSLCTDGEKLEKLDLLTLTFGTAYVYRLKESGMVVGNCHKIPGNEFTRTLLTPSEAAEALTPTFERLLKINPQMKILLTVSPIRHIRDGAHGNQVSKAVLMLTIEELRKAFPEKVFYFPAYEIVLDELRDYRFYDEDMIHPSTTAVNYIWECFRSTYFNEETNNIVVQLEEINRALAHRPFDEKSQAHANFKQKLLLKIESVKEKYPFFDFTNELKQCRTQ
ncbi:MAG: GSCFA domain-containing protein [Bacteroidaceae bacterium]|nr:GSCFA domain-containing protein [Bacteroidaceae bacterium]